MNKIRVIDLLNKIANGEELPKKIKFDGDIYIYDKECEDYNNLNHFGLFESIKTNMILNDAVEIIEEEKKIPEKLDVISWDKCIHDVTHKEKELAIEINKTQELLNNVIDYLKSKGE